MSVRAERLRPALSTLGADLGFVGLGRKAATQNRVRGGGGEGRGGKERLAKGLRYVLRIFSTTRVA